MKIERVIPFKIEEKDKPLDVIKKDIDYILKNLINTMNIEYIKYSITISDDLF